MTGSAALMVINNLNRDGFDISLFVVIVVIVAFIWAIGLMVWRVCDKLRIHKR